MALLDGTLQACRQRPLWEYPYLIMDVRYEKVRQYGQIWAAAVLMAFGVD
jgi:putative transposase